VSPIVREGRATLTLALPLMAGSVSQMLMGLADTLMIGEVGTAELAASTLAHSILFLPMMLGIGVGIAVSVKTSQARGAGKPEQAKSALRDGFLTSLLVGAISFFLSWASLPLLSFLGQDPEVIEVLPGFYLFVSASVAPAMVNMAVRSHSDGMAKPWPVFWIILGGVVLNVFFNWIFIFGNLGAPAMGLEGAGLATLLARLSSMAGTMAWCRISPDLRDWSPRRWFLKPKREELFKFWGTAWPASLQVSAEGSAFVAVAFFIGKLGSDALAAHTVAIQCVALTFMVPLGISMALTVQVGEAEGAQTRERMRPIVISGWLMGIVVSLFFVAVFLLFKEPIATAFLNEPGPRTIAISLLGVAAVMQMADHSQILSSGVLRGIDDVKRPALIMFLSHWVVGVPLGVTLGFTTDLGAAGIWWGLSTGLMLTAVLLGWRAWRMTGHRFVGGSE
jgi:MATE family multidrug resistance protein